MTDGASVKAVIPLAAQAKLDISTTIWSGEEETTEAAVWCGVFAGVGATDIFFACVLNATAHKYFFLFL